MTPALQVAAGGDAAASLWRATGAQAEAGTIKRVLHEGAGVVWPSSSPWLSTADDGQVLVVVDGLLHAGGGAAQGRTPTVKDLLATYRTHGDRLAEGLLGDYVVVVLDRVRRRLLVARDPVGVRPWHQAEDGPRHAGATRAAALVALPWVDASPDEAYAVRWLACEMRSEGRTFHRGVSTLAPGRTWVRDPHGTRVLRHHTWQVEDTAGLGAADADALARERLDLAVADRVRAAGQVSCDVSGGLDSSAVLGTTMLLGHQDVLAGRLVFESAAADERRWSDEVVSHWGVPIMSAAPWLPDDDEALELEKQLRRPPPDPNFLMFIPLYRALADAGRGTGLTGIGGDDAFVAASPASRLLSAAQLHRARQLRPVAAAALRHPRTTWAYQLRPALRLRVRQGRSEPRGYVTRAAAQASGLTDLLCEPPQRLTGVYAIDDRASASTNGYQAGILEDGAVVADLAGRRVSHPYFDPRLTAGVYGLDPSLAAEGGHSRAVQARAYADRLPPLIAARRDKAEFSEVAHRLMLDDARLHAVTTGPLVERGWLDLLGFARVVADARLKRPWAAQPVSRAVALDSWLRRA